MEPGIPTPWKRPLDLIMLALVAVPATALGLIAAVAIRISSRGPVLFRQLRAGHHQEVFMCLKFRTMMDGPNPLIPDQSRITPVGRWLRRTSLDELPQLLNVARGHMSFVGPRPMLVPQAAICDECQVERFAVVPGLTGWAQINGRNALSWPERIDLDIEYVRQLSLRLDLTIIAQTPLALLSGAGVEGHIREDPFVLGISDGP